MGVAADLGYEYRETNAFHRAMQAFGSTRFGAWFFSKTLAHLDRLVLRISGGRTSVPEILAALPVMYVTTTGRKTGQPRTSPLIAVPLEDTLALVGTNFGQTATPAWALNLEADPRLRVRYKEVERELATRPADDDERTRVWERASSVYPGYDKYRERIHGRTVRIFVLLPLP